MVLYLRLCLQPSKREDIVLLYFSSLILFFIMCSHLLNRCEPFFSVIQIKSNSIFSLKVNDCALVPRLRGGQKHSRLCCEIKKGSEKCLQHRCCGQASSTSTDMIKYLSQAVCTAQQLHLGGRRWSSTLRTLSNNTAHNSFFSFSFD